MSEQLRFGSLAIKRGLLTPKQVNECLEAQVKIGRFGVKPPPLGEIAVEKGMMDKETLQRLLDEQNAARPSRRAAAEPPEEEIYEDEEEEPEPETVRRRGRIGDPPWLKGLIGLASAGAVIVTALVALRLMQPHRKRPAARPRPARPARPVSPTQPATPAQPVTPAQPATPAQPVTPEVPAYRKALDALKEFVNGRHTSGEKIAECKKFLKEHGETPAAAEARRLLAGLESRADLEKAKLEQEACSAYVAMMGRVLEAKTQQKLWKALKELRDFPKKYAETDYGRKARGEADRLQAELGRRYALDVERLNRALAMGRLEEARSVVSTMETYAAPEVVREVRQRMKEASPGAGVKPETGPPEKRYERALTLMRHKLYPEAERLLGPLMTSASFVKAHPEAKERWRTLTLLLRVYRAAARRLREMQGESVEVPLFPTGRIALRLKEVLGITLIGTDEAGGEVRVPLTEAQAAFVRRTALEASGGEDAEFLLGAAHLYLERGDAKGADAALKAALAAGAKKSEVEPLLTRVEGPSARKGSAEVQELLRRAEALIGRGKHLEALSLLRRARTETAEKALLARIDSLLARCEKRLAVSRNPFAVKLLKRDDLGRRVREVFYDFEDASQLNDWREYNWYSIFDLHNSIWRLEGGWLRGSGSHGYLWRGYIKGDVTVEFDAYSTGHTQQNIQVTICDDGKGRNFLFGAGLVELGPGQDVIRFNQPRGMPQSMAKRPSRVRSMQRYHIKVERKGNILRFFLDGKEILRARARAYKDGHVGLFAAGSTVYFDNVRIIGQIVEKRK